MEEKYLKEIILYDESRLILKLKKFDLYNRCFETITINRDFFNEVSIKSKKEEIANDLRPLMSYIKSNDFTYSTIDIIDMMDKLYYKYDEDIFFVEKRLHIIDHISELAQIISFNTYDGKLRKNKEVEDTIYELIKIILNEYKIIIS
ncbi:hypothetical protein KQI86_03270 [Clostridium sp. MSJ-11]|uniref:Uncharacterized protein n=1 Tax=Clostridium mobile TaxID=2841512 RepID=A0ABS6EDQ5_9CLOT|nr:hypothetical protein [Clostridium mobile]MBU5483333.1 hypothetical protein [Clostridium mobile]